MPLNPGSSVTKSQLSKVVVPLDSWTSASEVAAIVACVVKPQWMKTL